MGVSKNWNTSMQGMGIPKNVEGGQWKWKLGRSGGLAGKKKIFRGVNENIKISMGVDNFFPFSPPSGSQMLSSLHELSYIKFLLVFSCERRCKEYLTAALTHKEE